MNMYLLKYVILKRLFFNFDGCRNGLHGTSDTNSMYKGLFFVKKIRNLNYLSLEHTSLCHTIYCNKINMSEVNIYLFNLFISE
jgi:hypothetical protein